MRLIDADAFIKSIPNFDLPEDTIDACTFRILLHNAPTVDTVLKAGWFIHPSGEFGTCTNCRQDEDFPEYIGKLGRYNKVFAYCPNCGAKMDEVSE